MRLRSTEPLDEPFVPVASAEDGPAVVDPSQLAQDVDPLIVVVHAPGDRLAEQARDIQSTLPALRLPGGKAPGSIAVIAVDAMEEAAVLIANIAVSAALSGSRTLLVDMEHSGFIQHKLLNLAPRLPDGGEQDDPWQLIQPTSIRSLFIMAAPALEGFGSDGAPLPPLGERLAALSSHYDLCLVDASHVDDLAAAAGSAESAIVAVQRDQTATSDLKGAINKLTMLNTALIGTVMLV